MKQLPNIIKILIILWILVGILFIIKEIDVINTYLDTIEMYDSARFFDDEHLQYSKDYTNYLFISNSILNFSCIFLSVFVSYIIYNIHKYSWIISIMFSSFLIYSAYNSFLFFIRRIFLKPPVEYEYKYSDVFHIILILIPIIIYYLFKPEVKKYFGKKTIEQTYH